MRGHRNSYVSIAGWTMLLAGALSFASCTSDETIDGIDTQGKAITFGNVSIKENSRAIDDPSYNANNPIDKFQVWGKVTGNVGSANLYNGALAQRNGAADGEAFTCTQDEYWIPSATYNFMAIANATSVTTANGLPTAINFNLTDGSKDLLLAEPVAVTTDETAVPTTGVNTNKCVPFTFSHLLSKVHFTFPNGSGITDINVTGHYASGVYTIGAATPWGSQVLPATSSPLSFGNLDTDATTSQYARLIIPGTQTWNITFKLNGTTISKPLTLENHTFAPNTEYNIIVTVGVDQTLTVVVQDWEGVTIKNNFADDVSVNSGDEIEWTGGNPTIANNQVAIDPLTGSATFKFRIAGPMGGTWNAILVTTQGNPNAFTITPNQGAVGEEAEVTITTNGANNTREANMAELRFVVQQGGKILPVANLTTSGENYIIVQNPAIN